MNELDTCDTSLLWKSIDARRNIQPTMQFFPPSPSFFDATSFDFAKCITNRCGKLLRRNSFLASFESNGIAERIQYLLTWYKQTWTNVNKRKRRMFNNQVNESSIWAKFGFSSLYRRNPLVPSVFIPPPPSLFTSRRYPNHLETFDRRYKRSGPSLIEFKLNLKC